MNTRKYLLPALLAPMLCAALPGASNPLAPRAASAQDAPEETAEESAQETAQPAGTVIEVTGDQYVVNVGKSLPQPKISFPKLAPKAGKARGYVFGSDGKPLKGALIGVRSTAVGGAETSASAKTDARGYYEVTVPFGAAGFYASGYTAEYGDGLVALGLKPSDGEADEFASAKGHVENWILVPHGIADRAAAQDDPKYVNNYYGGGLILYFHDENSPYRVEKLPFGSVAEVTLTPLGPLMDGSKGRPVTIRKPIREGATETKLFVNNIPVGRYRISGRLAGTDRTLHFKETGPDAGAAFGLEPKEAQGSATLLLRPYSARTASATAGKGNWKSVDIDVSG